MDVLETGPRPAAQPRRSLARRLDTAAFAGRRVGTARIVALVAIVAWLAAEVMPWAHLAVNPAQQNSELIVAGSPDGVTLHVFDLPPAVAGLLHIGFLLLLPALALALAGPDRVRRGAALVAGGFAVALVALLVALIATTSGPTGVTGLYLSQFTLYAVDTSVLTGTRGAGMYAALLAAALALASAVLAARSPAAPAAPVPPWGLAAGATPPAPWGATAVPGAPGAAVPPGWAAPAWPAPGAVPGVNGAAPSGSPVAAGPGVPWTAPGAPPLTWAGPESPAAGDPAWRPDDPDGWRRPERDAPSEPDEPLDLTVTPIPPTDHQLYLRPPR